MSDDIASGSGTARVGTSAISGGRGVEAKVRWSKYVDAYPVLYD